MLRPGGGLALLWNVWLGLQPPLPPDLDADIDRHRQAVVAAKHRYLSGAWREPLNAAASPFAPLQHTSALHDHRRTPTRSPRRSPRGASSRP